MHKTAAVLSTIATGAVGAFAFAALGVPAGSLIGASLGVALLGAIKGIGAMPERLRDTGFVVIGVSLGSGIDTAFAHHVVDWALSLGMLTLSLVLTLFAGAWVLQHVYGIDRRSAILASSPGTMSNAIALAIEGKGDVTKIMALQVVRLLVLVMLVPPLASVLDASPVELPEQEMMSALPLVGLLVASYGAGFLGQKAGLPAACLMAGLVLSGLSHALGLVHGITHPWVVFAGFAVTGATLGTRITKVGLRSLAAIARAGAVTVGLTLAISLVFAAITSMLSGLPLAQVWIAFAPGGVEAMAAIGLSLGYDPAFIALHHFTRIVVLVVLVPLALGPRQSG